MNLLREYARHNSEEAFAALVSRHINLVYTRDVYITSYVWNGAVCGYQTDNKTRKLNQFKPTAILQWEPDEAGSRALNDCSDYPYQGFTRRHGGTRNGDPVGEIRRMVTIGLFDGSSKRMSAGELNALAGIPDAGQNGPSPGTVSLPNELWCNPDSADGTPNSL